MRRRTAARTERRQVNSALAADLAGRGRSFDAAFGP